MNVLLVDDESYILEYVKHLVNWKELGFDRVLSESTSDSALEILKTTKIDLVVSDIRMPEKSGIDLLKAISKQSPETKVIFLTGYSEFEYARAGIQYGLFDYLLKPITKEVFEKTIVRFVQENEKKVLTKNEKKARVFQLLAYEDNNQKEMKNLFFSIEKPHVFYQKQNSLVDPIQWSIVPTETFSQEKNMKISASFTNISNMRQHFFDFFWTTPFEEELLFKTKRKMNKEIKEHTSKFYDTFYQTLTEEEKKYFIVLLIGILYKKNPEFNFDEIQLLEKPNECLEVLQKNISIKMIEPNDKESKKMIIKKVHEYINKNLESSLSLDELSMVVYLHPVYLSKLYKQETGSNLSAYILNQRLEKSAELLVDSQLLVSDIGKLVGYQTSQYFIKMFKEKYQMTPQQYRRQQLFLN